MLRAPVRMLRSRRCLPLSPKLRKKGKRKSPPLQPSPKKPKPSSILDERGQTIKKGVKEL